MGDLGRKQQPDQSKMCQCLFNLKTRARRRQAENLAGVHTGRMEICNTDQEISLQNLQIGASENGKWNEEFCSECTNLYLEDHKRKIKASEKRGEIPPKGNIWGKVVDTCLKDCDKSQGGNPDKWQCTENLYYCGVFPEFGFDFDGIKYYCYKQFTSCSSVRCVPNNSRRIGIFGHVGKLPLATQILYAR